MEIKPTKNHNEKIKIWNLELIRAQALKKTLFKGIITKQISIKKDAAELTDKVSPQFIKEISSVLKSSVFLFPDLGRRHLEGDRVLLNEKVSSVLIELLQQIAEANRIIDLKFRDVNSVLGNPISELEFGAKDGFYKKYERGAIYLSPNGIAHEVHGAIYQRYLSLRAEAGFLGYPETDEQSTVLGTGRFNHFQGGSIYWSQETGAWEIHGAIRDKWLTLFSDRSFLGFPTSNEEDYEGTRGKISHFKNGSIIFLWSDSSLVVSSDSVVHQINLSASSVNCNLEFSFNSAGDWIHKGHMHNSGFVGFNVTVLTTIRFQNAKGDIFGVPLVERHLDGTTSIGDERGDDWNEVGKGEQFIIDNWDTLKFSGIHSVMDVNVTFGDVLQLIGAALPIAMGVLILGTLFSGGRACPPRGHMRRNIQSGQDEPVVTIDIVGQDEGCPQY